MFWAIMHCLSSLRNITYNNYRVVVDNDSRDDSYEYLKEHEREGLKVSKE